MMKGMKDFEDKPPKLSSVMKIKLFWQYNFVYFCVKINLEIYDSW